MQWKMVLLGRIELVQTPPETDVFRHFLTFDCRQLCNSFVGRCKVGSGRGRCVCIRQ